MKDNTIRNTPDESTLWDRFLSGDKDAYSCIYKKYVQILFSYGLQFTSDRELIKDCIQDVFEKLHNNRDKLKPTDNLKVYLFVILKNSLINVLKKEATYFQHIDKIDHPHTEEVTAIDKLEEKEEQANTKKKIENIFSLLTSRQKEIMYYRFVEELEIKQIATLMDMNYQSVLNVIQRSLKKIREDMRL